MPAAPDPTFPAGNTDERELLLSWLAWLRGAVLRKIDGLNEVDARWTPEGALISQLGIVNHLTHVEWRWIDGAMRGAETTRLDAEFRPEPVLTVASAVDAYSNGLHVVLVEECCFISSTRRPATRATPMRPASCWTD